MNYVFEVIDKTNRKVRLSLERWKHIKKHPFVNEHLESMQLTLKEPLTIRLEYQENILYFYKEFKNNEPSERYLLVLNI